MKMEELTKKHLEHLTPNKDGYKIDRLKKLYGNFIPYYEGKKIGDKASAYEAAKKLEAQLLDKYPDIKTPFLYFSEDKSNNLSVGDSEGEYMDAELRQL